MTVWRLISAQFTVCFYSNYFLNFHLISYFPTVSGCDTWFRWFLCLFIWTCLNLVQFNKETLFCRSFKPILGTIQYFRPTLFLYDQMDVLTEHQQQTHCKILSHFVCFYLNLLNFFLFFTFHLLQKLNHYFFFFT